jgi:tetratricopeptide (TPR) repeat protein
VSDSDDSRDPGGQKDVPATDPATGQPENRRARRAAASSARKKGQRIPERPQANPMGLDAGEIVDDAMSRAADGGMRWIKNHFNVVQWVIVLGIAGWIGFQIYSWRSDKTAVKVSGLLSEAVAAELGRTGSPDEEGQADARGSIDARRVFATNEDRLKEAREAYEKVSAEHPGTPGANLAKLGLAGVLFDQGKYDEAAKLYQEVASSDLGKLDPESKGNALEGLGLCLEAKGDRDGALKRYAELENADIPGFRDVALYNQARILHAKGDDAGAKERLKKILDKAKKDKEAQSADNQSYVTESARALLTRIDPSAVPQESSDDAIRRALEQFGKSLPPGIKQVPGPVPNAP